jgi:hypothetical protein
VAWFQSYFIQKQVFGKITHGYLKFLSRRVSQGFQRTYHDAKESGKTEKKQFLKHDAPLLWFHSKTGFWDYHLWPPENSCRNAKGSGEGSGEAEKTLKHDVAWFQSYFIQKQVFGKITHSHLKIISRRVCQGFQRTCHDAKEWLGFKVVSLRK